jgi:hypothetical protein
MLVCAPPAVACLVCVEQPDDTLTDRVWAAGTVVLARNTPEDAFLYQVVETLSGEIREPIAFVVNSVERRRMAADADRIAVFLHEPRGWSIAGHGGADFAALVRAILANEEHWSDTPNDPDRTGAFAALHAHPDPAIRRLALTELSRVPYARLRGMAIDLDVDWLAAGLSDPAWFGWWPILAQMLGLHADPLAHALVRARAFDVPAATRAPWLMALIEIDGTNGIDRLIAEATDETDARAAARALIAHAYRAHELAPELAKALRHLPTGNPEIAAEAVVGLHALGDTSFAPQVARILAEDLVDAPAAVFALRSYLSASWGMDAERAVRHAE